MKTVRRRLLIKLAIWLGPPLYKAYMAFVFWTSRVEQKGMDRLFAEADGGGISLGAAWHQDIFAGAYFMRARRPVTMVSRSADGEIAANVIRRCGYVPVRGSSSRGGKEALAEMLEYLRTHRGVTIGLVVDGPRGPARRSKMGIIVLAREAGVPLYPLRIWAQRHILLRSWDRTMIPLPFNRILAWAGEPIVVPPDVNEEAMEQHRAELERRMNDLVRLSLERFPQDQPTRKLPSS